LVIIISITSLRFIVQGSFAILNQFDYNIKLGLLNPLFLIVIPSFYLYFKSLIEDYKHLHFKDLYHAIFPLANVLLSLSQRYYPAMDNKYVNIFQFVAIIAFFLFYLLRSFYVLYTNLWKAKKIEFTSNKHYQLINNWTRFLFLFISLLSFRLLISLIIERTTNLQLSGFSFFLIALVFWGIIFGKILSNPEILYGLPKLEARLNNYSKPINISYSIWDLSNPSITNLQDSKLKDNIMVKIEPYIIDVEIFIESFHPFRDSGFNINNLAKELNIPSSHLAYIFKYHCKVPFVEFKKYCKINDALKLIKEDYLDSMTFDAMAYKTGFNSYNSFFVAFKKETGLSPKDFIASEKN
jgi:AraC-like DNA-binding protein